MGSIFPACFSRTATAPEATHECRSVDSLVIISSEGRAFTVPIASLPDGRGMGAPLPSFIEIGAGRIAHVLTGKPEDELLFAKTSGYGFICTFADLLSRQKAGKSFLTMEDGAGILPPARVAGTDHVAALSADGRLLVFPLDQMKRLVRRQGRADHRPARARSRSRPSIAARGPVVSIKGTFRNKPKTLLSEEKHLGQRARRGAAVGLLNHAVIGKLEP